MRFACILSIFLVFAGLSVASNEELFADDATDSGTIPSGEFEIDFRDDLSCEQLLDQIKNVNKYLRSAPADLQGRLTASIVAYLRSDRFKQKVNGCSPELQAALKTAAKDAQSTISTYTAYPSASSLEEEIADEEKETKEAAQVVSYTKDLMNQLEKGLTKDGVKFGENLVKRLQSDEVKKALDKVPKKLRNKAKHVIKKFLDERNESGEKIKKHWNYVKQRLLALEILADLKDSIRNVKNFTALERASILKLLDSDDFKNLVNKMPPKLRLKINILVAKLRILLEIKVAETYGIRDKWEEAKKRLEALKVVKVLKDLYYDLQKQAGVTRDLAILKLQEFINSEQVQSILSWIPDSLKSGIMEKIEQMKELAKFAGERLQLLWEETKVRSSLIIDAIKDDSEALGITAKLIKARDLINQKSADAQKQGREMMLEILNSEAFILVASKLPKSVQETAKKLKEELEGGVTSGYSIDEDIAELTDKFTVKEVLEKIKEFFRGIKQITGLAKELSIQFMKDLIDSIPGKIKTFFKSVIDKINEMAAASKIRLEKLLSAIQEKSQAIIDSVKDKAEDVGITAKLREAQELLKQKSLKAKELGRQKMLAVLNSEAFRRVAAKLPQSVQDKADELRKSLQGSETTAFYGISDSLENLKRNLAFLGLRLFMPIKNLWDEIQSKVGVARDFAILKLEALWEDITAKIPESLKAKFKALSEKIKTMAGEAKIRLEKLLSAIQEKSQAIIDSVKDKAEDVGITAKLREAQELLKQKSLKAKELGRQKMLAVLNSEAFRRVAAKLPQSVQDKADELRKSLQGSETTDSE